MRKIRRMWRMMKSCFMLFVIFGVMIKQRKDLKRAWGGNAYRISLVFTVVLTTTLTTICIVTPVVVAYLLWIENYFVALFSLVVLPQVAAAAFLLVVGLIAVDNNEKELRERAKKKQLCLSK